MAQTPIIIKKVSGHAAHHGGAWKVAYADFVTAMMALFIVLWLMNSSKQIQVAVGGYFKDPTGNSKKVGSAYTGSGENVSISKDNMTQLKELLQQSMKQMTNFESLKNHIEMTITAEGLRIELLEGKGDTFFQSGVAQPSDNGREIMLTLAQELGKLPNQVAVEGHTDSKPYTGGRDYDNWELSAARANSARRVMQQNGLGAQQVSQVRGYADQRPRKGHDAQDPTNRRISVIVQYLNKPEEAETPVHPEPPKSKKS